MFLNFEYNTLNIYSNVYVNSFNRFLLEYSIKSIIYVYIKTSNVKKLIWPPPRGFMEFIQSIEDLFLWMEGKAQLRTIMSYS